MLYSRANPPLGNQGEDYRKDNREVNAEVTSFTNSLDISAFNYIPTSFPVLKL